MLRRTPFPIFGLLIGIAGVGFFSAVSTASAADTKGDVASAAEVPDASLSESCPLAEQGGLVALYDFRDKSGDVVRDRAGTEAPIDLRITEAKSVRRHNGSLEIIGPTLIRSNKETTRLVDAVRTTGEITVEAWVRPATLDQDGPARMVTLSRNSGARNFTLGQDKHRYEFRLRTTDTGDNGVPSLASEPKSVRTRLSHVVYTRGRGGQAGLFVDGESRGTADVDGEMSNWDGSFRLALGNELSSDRPWLGTFHRVAIYNRALSPAEIAGRFRAGAAATVETADRGRPAEETQRRLFQTSIAPLLAQHCLECHDAATGEGGLDLSHKTRTFAGGDSGEAIVPGDAEASLLWQLVESDAMPLDREPLSGDEKAALRKWINAGAVWTDEFLDPAIYRHAGDHGQQWLRRLTVSEYVNTVRDASGVEVEAEAKKILPRDKRADGFANTAYNLSVDLGHVEAYAKLAEIVVDRMDVAEFASRFHDGTRLTDNNMRALIKKMGGWLLRGPLREHEIATYRGISTTVASAGGGYEEAVRYIIKAMLQSPRFLYRVERQRGDGSEIPATPHELASRISYIVWGGPPDRELMRAADSGRLYDCRVIERQVRRMLEDPRAVARSREFISQWLNLDGLTNLRPNGEKFPEWKRELAADMRRETLAFFEDVVWKQRRPLANLLNAQVTYLTPRLADHYGVALDTTRDDAPAGDPQRLRRVDLSDVPSRGGILTQGSVLTIGGDEASMVTRGLFVLHDLLFSEVGDPPPGLDTTPVPASPGRSRREIAEERVESVSCGGCHSRFEPLAFGLERFDGLGSYYEIDEHGNELRQDGEILFPGESEPVSFETTDEMMQLLADSDRVARCLTRKVVQFSLGRPLTPRDQPALGAIHTTARKNGGTYKDVIEALVMSELVQITRTEPDDTKQPH